MQIDDSKPIWAQLVDEFRRRIAAGVWSSGEKLPSVRELALDLGVNPNTVQKALTEIDRQGLTVTERTSGRFVTADTSVIAAARTALAADTVDGFTVALSGIGMDLGEAVALLERRWPEATARGGAAQVAEAEAVPGPETKRMQQQARNGRNSDDHADR